MCNQNMKEKAKVVCEKVKQRAKDCTAKTVQYAKKLPEKMPEIKEKAKEYTKKTVTYAKNVPAKLPILMQKIKEISRKIVNFVKNLPMQLPLIKQRIQTVIAEAKQNPKQAVVALVILLFALILMIMSLGKEEESISEPSSKEIVAAEQVVAKPAVKEIPVKQPIKIEPQNAVVTFTATAEKEFTYAIYYTVEREVWFEEKYKVEYPGKIGKHKYSIVLPEKEVFRVRIDFGSNPGEVTIKDIFVTGSQKADLNNFADYELHQFEKTTQNKDGSFTIKSTQEDPYMAFLDALLPE